MVFALSLFLFVCRLRHNFPGSCPLVHVIESVLTGYGGGPDWFCPLKV